MVTNGVTPFVHGIQFVFHTGAYFSEGMKFPPNNIGLARCVLLGRQLFYFAVMLFTSHLIASRVIVQQNEVETPSTQWATWAPRVRDDLTYRKNTFRNLMKSFKRAVPPATELNTPLMNYEITLHIIQRPHKGYQQPNKPIQMMIFGREGYLSPKLITFQRATEQVSSGEPCDWIMTERWEARDIGEVEAVGVGYEHGSHHSIYVEQFSILKNPVAPEDESRSGKYRVPCYRWLSTHKSDGAVFRMLWAHNDRLRPNLQSIASELASTAHISGVRKVGAAHSSFSRSYVEHCLHLRCGEARWHRWMRYETLAVFQQLLRAALPQKRLEKFFPNAHRCLTLASTDQAVAVRQKDLDQWIAVVLNAAQYAGPHGPITEALLWLPPRGILECTSPLSVALQTQTERRETVMHTRRLSLPSPPIEETFSSESSEESPRPLP